MCEKNLGSEPISQPVTLHADASKESMSIKAREAGKSCRKNAHVCTNTRIGWLAGKKIAIQSAEFLKKIFLLLV